MKDLAGVSQRELLRDRGSRVAEDAKLTAVKVVRRDPQKGKIWLTKCECGGEREVPTNYFTTGRIRKCESCINPHFVPQIQLMNASRAELRNQFYPEAFKKSWREKFAAFDSEQMLLFETIMDRRRRCPAMMMQAVDLVIRASGDIEYELDTFSDARVERARERLAKGIVAP
jgi:hypothetical protein